MKIDDFIKAMNSIKDQEKKKRTIVFALLSWAGPEIEDYIDLIQKCGVAPKSKVIEIMNILIIEHKNKIKKPLP
jgi:hypothetical protein